VNALVQTKNEPLDGSFVDYVTTEYQLCMLFEKIREEALGLFQGTILSLARRNWGKLWELSLISVLSEIWTGLQNTNHLQL